MSFAFKRLSWVAFEVLTATSVKMTVCGMLTDVSEELTAYVIRVMNAINLIMEYVSPSERSVSIYQTIHG
jgi:hypothetical protein